MLHHEINVLIFLRSHPSRSRDAGTSGLLSEQSDKPGVWHHRQLFFTVNTPSSDNIVHLEVLETL